MQYPQSLPNRLKPLVTAAVTRAEHNHPHGRESTSAVLQDRLKDAMFAVGEIVCKAAEDGEWRADLALDGLETFLRILIGYFYGPYSRTLSEIERNMHTQGDALRATKQWLGFVERLAAVAEKAPEPKRSNEPLGRVALRDQYLRKFPDAVILDICWSAKQHYREWTRWIGGHLKAGSKPDRCFTALLTSGKSPRDYRIEPRPKNWK